MKFLLDQNQSPLLADLLTAVGHDAIHTRDIGLSRAPDVDVLTRAKLDGRVLITADTDFGELLARSGDDAPSVLLLRRHDRRRAEAVAELILANLDAIESDLTSRALVVFDGDRNSERCRSVRRSRRPPRGAGRPARQGGLSRQGGSEGPR